MANSATSKDPVYDFSQSINEINNALCEIAEMTLTVKPGDTVTIDRFLNFYEELERNVVAVKTIIAAARANHHLQSQVTTGTSALRKRTCDLFVHMGLDMELPDPE